MNTYKPTSWVDHVVDETSGQVIQQGTPISAENLNNIELGIYSNDLAVSVLAQQSTQLKRSVVDLEGEKITQTLTNSQEYPFNNSIVTVPLVKTRDTTNYTVQCIVLSSVGIVGDIIVSDKALNGFKLKYTGSATSAIIAMVVRGGMYQ